MLKKSNLALLIIFFISILSNCSTPNATNIEMSAVFNDHMVLQRNIEIPVWGTGNPGGIICVEFAGQKKKSKVNTDGNWNVILDPVEAGGPYKMSIIGSNTKTFTDVLVGEVWLCSGQSNMDMKLIKSGNSMEEIKNAEYPNIRLCKIIQNVSDKPEFTFAGQWEVCNPENATAFSAVGYFFGRKLHKDLNVPVGLIQSSWGGTPAEAWTHQSYLQDDPVLSPILKRYEKNIQDYPEKLKEWKELIKKIESENLERPMYQKDEGNKGIDKGWAKSDFDDNEWKNFKLPQQWENVEGMDIDGAIWFRKEVNIPEKWSGKDLILSLGPIDDFDISYFDGVKIGQTGEETPSHWIFLRKYEVPGKLVKSGKVTIAVRVFDRYGGGGFPGAKSQMRLSIKGDDDQSDVIQLSGIWKQKIEQKMDPENITGPGGGKYPKKPMGKDHPHSPQGLYNGMIHPIAPFALKGAIWYQGEQNASKAFQYQKLLPAMITNWRNLWNQEKFYFGIVQLANYMSSNEFPEESAWAELREAQAMTAQNLEDCGLALAIDIGEAADIHPTNKQDVGKRLALWALAEAYGQDLVFSGPRYKKMEINKNKVIVTFDHQGDGLKVKGEKLQGFTIAGEDRQFFRANAKIDGGNVIVWSDGVSKPVSIRYAWANNPVCNLYNSADLPAIPFRTDTWPGSTYGIY